MRVPPAKSGTSRETLGTTVRPASRPSPGSERTRDPGEAGGEEEDLDPIETSRHAVEKVQQHPRVPLHRAADVADQDEGTPALRPLASWQRDELAAVSEVATDEAPDVEAWSPTGGPPTGAAHPEIPAELGEELSGLAELLVGQVCEVLLSDGVAVAVAQGRRALHLESWRAGLLLRRRRRWGLDLRCSRPPALAHGPQVAGRPLVRRASPEDPEGLVEEGQVLGPMDEDAAERVIEVALPSHVHVGQRADQVQRSERLRLHPEPTEHAGEVEQVREQGAHRAAGCLARLSIDCTRSPRIDWMSSWFLRMIPSVWSIVSASSSWRSRATSAATQSSVSDTPATL